MRRIRARRGAALFRSGERVHALFAIRSGCVKEVDTSVGRHGLILNFATAGETLILQSLAGMPSRTTVIAIEPSHVCVIPWNAFNQSLVSTPPMLREFTQLVAEAGVKARDSVALMRDKEAPQRVAFFLLDMQARTQPHGARTCEFRLPMNRDDIANYLGIRSETVSRCMTELARRRLIKVRAKRVQILEPQELERMASGA